jgi:hypothetical protein
MSQWVVQTIFIARQGGLDGQGSGPLSGPTRQRWATPLQKTLLPTTKTGPEPTWVTVLQPPDSLQISRSDGRSIPESASGIAANSSRYSGGTSTAPCQEAAPTTTVSISRSRCGSAVRRTRRRSPSCCRPTNWLSSLIGSSTSQGSSSESRTRPDNQDRRCAPVCAPVGSDLRQFSAGARYCSMLFAGV